MNHIPHWIVNRLNQFDFVNKLDRGYINPRKRQKSKKKLSLNVSEIITDNKKPRQLLKSKRKQVLPITFQKKCMHLWTEFEDRNSSLTINQSNPPLITRRIPSLSPQTIANHPSSLSSQKKNFKNSRRYSEAYRTHDNEYRIENSGTQCDIEEDSEEEYFFASKIRSPMIDKYKLRLPQLL